MKRMSGLLMMVGLVIGVGCGDDDSSPTSSSVSQDKYSETIEGTWTESYGGPGWTFNADRTGVDDVIEEPITWSIVGSTLTITHGDDYIGNDYDRVIISMSSTELVYMEKSDSEDGSGTIEEEVTLTR